MITCISVAKAGEVKGGGEGSNDPTLDPSLTIKSKMIKNKKIVRVNGLTFLFTL